VSFYGNWLTSLDVMCEVTIFKDFILTVDKQ
jgi:hypothetical protein